MTREQKIEEAAIRLDNLLGALSLPVPDRIHVLALREALPEIRALLEPTALAAPVEPAVAVDVTEKEEDDAVYLLGHRAGAEWMREQAAVQADVQAGSDSSGDEWDVAWNKSAEIVAKRIRALPTSPPAPSEAK